MVVMVMMVVMVLESDLLILKLNDDRFVYYNGRRRGRLGKELVII